MSYLNSDESNTLTTDPSPKSTKPRLLGAALDGADQKAAVGHTDYEKSRSPDTELHLDGEDDRLYSDGLDIEDDTESLAGTDGNAPKGIKG
jgi:hypothetical protein